MLAATGRDLDDVQTAARCLVSLVGDDASPEQLAAAHLLAFGLLDLHRVAVSLSGST